jgi:hypothetical protein
MPSTRLPAPNSGLTALDLISTPVPVLPERGLVTHVGLSGDDPLATRFGDERFEVLLTSYDSDGRWVGRQSLGEVGPRERRWYDVSSLAGPVGSRANRLAVVHRVPRSICPEDADPSLAEVGAIDQETYALYRAVVQLSIPGGPNGSVVYETPPRLNDSRRGPRRSTALMFSSKVRVAPGASSSVCIVHHSLDPAHGVAARVRMLVFDEDGAVLARDERIVRPFTVELTPVAKLVDPELATRARSVVAWSKDAALLFLLIQQNVDPPAVSLEHTHPPQTYLLPSDLAVRYRIKAAAIDRWDTRWERGS